MAGNSKSAKKMNINLPDEDATLALKTVLAYEAGVRGRTIGQVCSDLVVEAVDVESYPQEVRDRLDELAEEATRRAVLRSLKMSE